MKAFKALRVFVLLLILLGVAYGAWSERRIAQSWTRTQQVVVYPINLNASSTVGQYLGTLKPDSFAGIDALFAAEAEHYRLGLSRPVQVHLGGQLASAPPLPPADAGMLGAMWWSLKLRWWAWRNTPESSVRPDVRLFVLYHDPREKQVLPHSTGLAKGRLGVVHVFAEPAQHGSNQVVLAHELLHTFGATDKYDPADGLPLYPDGYANPEQQPRWPQRAAEIMGGRIPLSATVAETPESPRQVLFGAQTAREIGWTKPAP